jgi:ATP-binding protein involved in chromosome partitioning
MGFLVPAGEAVVWRGPMLHGAITQFLRDTDWGELDYLIIDMPPGTGDIALIDARKAVTMFDKVGVPILGIVENMAVHVCSNCGHAEHIFGEGGGKRYAEEKEIDYLGALPLALHIREQADSGKPTVIADPESEAAKIYRSVARQVAIKIAAKSKDFSAKFPTISVSKST